MLPFSPENLTLFIWKSRKFCVTLYDTPNSTFYTTKKNRIVFCYSAFFISLYPTFKKVDIICPLFKSSGFFVFLFCHTSFYFGEIVTANPIIGDNIKPSFVLVDNHTEALKIIIHNIKPLFVAASSRL